MLNFLSKDIGIDLGTANTLVYVKGQGITLNEPSVVALNKRNNQVLAVGQEAKEMVGRTPTHIVAVRPLVAGIISDFETAELMLRYFIGRTQPKFSLLAYPRVVAGIPAEVTEVEKKAVEDAIKNAGAREALLIEESLASAIGADLPIQEATGSLVVDIGGGTTEIAVLSLGGVVIQKTLRVAGDQLTQDIISFIRTEFNLLVGERTAEELKIKIGSAISLGESQKAVIRGRDLIRGLPKEVEISDEQVRIAMGPSLDTLVSAVREVVEATPPELIADIMQRGIYLTGGGSLLRGLDRLLADETEVVVRVTEDPLTTLIRGIGIVLENTKNFRDILANL